MGDIKNRFDSAFRSYSTEGVRTSGVHEPVKSDIRAIAPVIEAQIAAAAIAGGNVPHAEALIAPLLQSALSAQAAAEAAIEQANGAVDAAIALAGEFGEMVAAAGYTIVEEVRAKSTGNVNIANPGTATFDAVTLSNGDALLLGSQTAGPQNGIYIFNGSGSALTRRTDFDETSEVKKGCYVTVREGDNQSGAWVLTTPDPITVGTTAQTWQVFRRDQLRADLKSSSSAKGSKLVKYLQAGTGGVAYDLQARLRHRVYLADFDASGAGTGDQTGKITAAWNAAAAKKSAVWGTPNSIYRHDSTIALAGGYTSLIGAEEAPLGNLALPSAVLRGYGSGPQLTLAGTSNIIKNWGLENYGSHTHAIKFNLGGHHVVRGISCLLLAGTGRYESLFHSAINALGYSDFSHIATDGRAVEKMFYATRTEAAPGETSGNNPMVVSHIREASSYSGGGDHYGFFWEDANVESVLCQYATWNQYGGILRGWDSADSDGRMDWATNTAFQCVAFIDQEIDFSTNVESDFFNVHNVAQFILDRATINLAGQPCLGVLRNSFADIRNVLMSSCNGPMWKILDLQSRVRVGQGNKLNKTNTAGFANPTVAMAGCSCTVITSTGSHQVTISNVTGRVEPGMPLVASGTFNSFHVVREQRSGEAGKDGVYTLYARPLQTGSVIATQTAKVYPTNSGIQIVPALIDQFGDYVFNLEERLLEEGVEWFRLDIDENMVVAGVGRAFTIAVANNVFSPTIYPVSSRTRGSGFGLMIRNTSGYPLGAVTWSGIKKSDTLALPATGKAMTMKLVNDVTVAAGVGTTVYMQDGLACSDITL